MNELFPAVLDGVLGGTSQGEGSSEPNPVYLAPDAPYRDLQLGARAGFVGLTTAGVGAVPGLALRRPWLAVAGAAATAVYMVKRVVDVSSKEA
jgi:hypothetical protein